MLKQESLKECPFCSGKNIEILAIRINGQNYYHVYCNCCGSSGARKNVKTIAVSAWNRRCNDTNK